MAHYKDQFKLPPKPFDVGLDVMIKMFNHCYKSESKVSLINSAFGLVKLCGGSFEEKNGNILMMGFSSDDDSFDVQRVISRNYQTAKQIMGITTIFNGD